jgi:hypothetical protein
MLYFILDRKKAGCQGVVFGCQNGREKDIANTVVDSKTRFVPGIEGKEYRILREKAQEAGKVVPNESGAERA